MAESRSGSRTPPRSYRKRQRSSSRHRERHSRHRHRRSTRRRHRSITSRSSMSSWSTRSYSGSPQGRTEKDRPVDPPPSTCLGVFGLSHFTLESTLLTVFGKYGPIDKVMIVYDAKTKSSRGFGFVYFAKLEDASAAKVQCNGMVIHERTIRVDYSVTERPHTPTPGVYMGERDAGERRHRSSYSYRGRSYDDDYHHGRSRRSSSRHRRRRSSRHRHHRRRRSYTRSRSRSWTRYSSR